MPECDIHIYRVKLKFHGITFKVWRRPSEMVNLWLRSFDFGSAERLPRSSWASAPICLRSLPASQLRCQHCSVQTKIICIDDSEKRDLRDSKERVLFLESSMCMYVRVRKEKYYVRSQFNFIKWNRTIVCGLCTLVSCLFTRPSRYPHC